VTDRRAGPRASVPASLTEVLRQHARRVPDRRALLFLPDGEREAEDVSYAELDRRITALSARLQAECAAGERVLVLLPSGVDYLVSLFACMAAGAIAVPVFPPANSRHGDRIAGVAADCEPRIAITDRPSVAAVTEALGGTAVWADDELPREDGEAFTPPPFDLDAVAYLQYTSGSTGRPRGVMVTHRSLLHQLGLLAHGMTVRESDVNVSWLPLFHDLGLVLAAVTPLWQGSQVVLMPPAAFVQRPVRWLAAITRYGGTVSHGPTFAFDLCVRRIGEAERAGLDLSTWRVSGVGAEVVRPDTLERFAAEYAESGFRLDTFTPGLGLAETTLVVANRDRGAPLHVGEFDAAALAEDRLAPPREGRPSRRIVSNGHPWLDTELRIVDPETRRPVAPGRIGEIWIRGETVAAGYWRQPEATAEAFAGRLEDGDGPFLRTGDMAAFEDGHLFITGRHSGRIVIRGRNHYPNDLEQTVAGAHPALGSRGAAFSIEVDGEERLAVAHELSHPLRAEPAEVVRAVRRAIAEAHELAVEAVTLLRPGGVPVTSSGKIRRAEARDRHLRGELDAIHTWHAAEEPVPGPDRQPADIAGWLAERVAEAARLPVQEVGLDRPLTDFGVDSAATVELTGRLQEWLGRPVDPTIVYLHPTIARLAAALGGEAGSEPAPMATQRPAAPREPIAVVGLACRFPGAASAGEFWSLLSRGEDAIREVPESRWRPDGTPGLGHGGFVDGVDELDAAFFGISRSEAEAMDPQQRLLLTETWRALEHAGIPPERLAGSDTGVFVGISTGDYRTLRARDGVPTDAHAGTGTAFSVAANRISYLLDLHGPSLAVDTACSSSLVALHQACQSLRMGECDLAIVGAVNLLLEPEQTRVFSAAGMMAAGGRCRAFDAGADGYVRGEGAGVVVLERQADAVRHRDRVLGLVRGSAVNQDGQSNGLTAPNGLAQRAVVRRALAAAGVEPAQVGYVEAHGTGTPLGDPVEMGALRDVYGAQADEPLWVGSVKTNVGHLEAAAGMAGLIKVLLALEHGAIPAHLHLRELNPRIALEGSRCAIPVEATPWPRNGRPRLAGISSFGFGGTNAHVIVEEAPAPAAAPAADGAWHVLPVSARTAPALAASVEAHAAHLAGAAEPLAAAAHTAGARREHGPHRVAVLARSTGEAAELLARHARGEAPPAVVAGVASRDRTGRLAFLFTGQGSQHPGMARALHGRHAGFTRALERCDEVVRSALGASLLPALCDLPGERVDLDRPRYAQPALFALEYALAEAWRGCGIEPDLVLGHSLGEYAAACVAGVLELEDALGLVVARAVLSEESAPEGGMLAVRGPAPELERLRGEVAGSDRLAVAAYNGPEDLVLAGDAAALAEVAARWRGRVHATRLHVTRAYHSPLMRPVADEFARHAHRVAYRRPRVPLVSNVGGAVAGPEIADPAYWVRHLTEPVRFGDGLRALLEAGCRTFVEVGPQPVLSALGRAAAEDALWLPSLTPREADDARFLRTAAELHVAGAPLDWDGLWRSRSGDEPAPLPVELPGHPLRPRRHWYQAGGPRAPLPGTGTGHPLLGRRLDLAGAAGARFAGELAADTPWYVAQHRLFGAATLPASALVEWGLAAAGADALEHVVLPRLLTLPDDRPVPVQAAAEAGGVRCFARAGEEWAEHLAADAATPGTPGEPLPLDALRARLPAADPEELYERLRERGLEYGPGLRGVRRLWREGREALGLVEVELPPGDEYRLHPAVLDACLHVAAAAADLGAGAPVPVAADRVEIHGRLPGRVWCHAAWREDGAADLRVAGESGEPLAAITGLRVHALGEASRPLAYEVRWEPLEPGQPQLAAGAAWLVCGPDAAASRAWRDELAALGQPAEAVDPDWTDGGVEELLAGLRGRGLRVAGLLLRGDRTPAGDVAEAAEALAAGAFAVLQRLLRSCLADRPEVVICSRGAAGEDAAQSVLGGLARALVAELPSLRCVQVDLDPGAPDPGVRAVLEGAAGPHGSGQVSLRGGLWRIARLAEAHPEGGRPAVRSDATYLVTGGWGGIGLAIAGWLAARGARSLALVGRALPLVEPAEVARLRTAGVEVALLEADVADPAALERALTAARAMAPLRGVVHAAGAAADGPLEELDAERFAVPLRAKVRGTWHLHRLTAGDALEWFVTCSSLTAVAGSAGQANYVVANAFQDGLARWRRTHGLPALSVGWGPWAETGMAARGGQLERYARQGVRGLTTDAALRSLNDLLGGDAAHVAVADVDWERFLDAAAGLAPDTLLAVLAPPRGMTPSRRAEVERLAVESPDAARLVLLDDLLDRVAIALGLDDGEREELRPAFADTRLNQLGLDSLMAVRLRTRLLAELGADVPPQALIGGSTVRDVVALIVEQLAFRQIVAGDDEPVLDDAEVITL
jgi:phthiocerol/phenolphthiocerol synthesis type-I polyketide synthase C